MVCPRSVSNIKKRIALRHVVSMSKMTARVQFDKPCVNFSPFTRLFIENLLSRRTRRTRTAADGYAMVTQSRQSQIGDRRSSVTHLCLPKVILGWTKVSIFFSLSTLPVVNAVSVGRAFCSRRQAKTKTATILDRKLTVIPFLLPTCSSIPDRPIRRHEYHPRVIRICTPSLHQPAILSSHWQPYRYTRRRQSGGGDKRRSTTARVARNSRPVPSFSARLL